MILTPAANLRSLLVSLQTTEGGNPRNKKKIKARKNDPGKNGDRQGWGARRETGGSKLH